MEPQVYNSPQDQPGRRVFHKPRRSMCVGSILIFSFFLPLVLRMDLFSSHLSTRTAYEFGPYACYVHSVSHQQDFFVQKPVSSP